MLHDRRLGLARSSDPSHWPEALLATLVTGGVGYCHHDSLRGFDARTAAVLEQIEACGRLLTIADLPGSDLVHWDLRPGNLAYRHGSLPRSLTPTSSSWAMPGSIS